MVMEIKTQSKKYCICRNVQTWVHVTTDFQNYLASFDIKISVQ